jgi:hypothetical protein
MKRRIRAKELSWLSFNARVLQEAADPNVPVLERVKFLGIFSSNLDEFFRVRVGTLKRLARLGKKAKTILGDQEARTFFPSTPIAASASLSHRSPREAHGRPLFAFRSLSVSQFEINPSTAYHEWEPGGNS